MAIVKNSFSVSRLDGDFSPGCRDSVCSEDDDDELQSQSSETESDSPGISEVDSGMGSDDYDLSELGEAGFEFCQVGNQSCMIPFELYDLSDMSSILSLDTWNNCLTEEERFALAEYLPDMDQETFVRTLKELFSGSNFHFGSPVVDLFNRLKGGLCEPTVDLYRRSLNFVQKHEHYHRLRQYQNSMVGSLVRIRDAWENHTGYGIEERLRLLNILRSQRPLGYVKKGDEGSETDSENEETGGGFWNKRLSMGWRAAYPRKPSLDVLSCGSGMALEPTKYGKENPKGILKVAGLKASLKNQYIGTAGRFPSVKHSLETKYRPSSSVFALSRPDPAAGFELGTARKARSQMRDVDDDDMEEQLYGTSVQRGSKVAWASLLKPVKNHEFLKRCQSQRDSQFAFADEDPESYGASNSFGRSRNASQSVTVASYDPNSDDGVRKRRYPEWNSRVKDYVQHLMPKGGRVDRSSGRQPFQHSKAHEEALSMDRDVKLDDWNIKSKKKKTKEGLKVKACKTIPAQTGEPLFHSNHRAKASLLKIRKKSSQIAGVDVEYHRGSRLFAQSEETESDSSEQVEEEGGINPLINKLRHTSGALENHQPATVKSVYDSKKTKKHKKKDKKEYTQYLDRGTVSRMPDTDIFSSKGKLKGKSSGSRDLHGYAAEKVSASANLPDDKKPNYKLMKKGQLQDNHSNRSQLPLLNTPYPVERKRKAMVDPDYAMPQVNYTQDYANGIKEEEDGDFDVTPKSMDSQVLASRSVNRGQVTEVHAAEADRQGRSNMSILGCNTVTRKRKEKADDTYLDGYDEPDYLQSNLKKQIDDPNLMKKKGKKRADAGPDSLPVVIPNLIMSEKETADVEPEIRPPKKPFTLITPTVHTGFSFSIIHLFSAIRKAMISINAEDAAEIGNHLDKNDGRQKPTREDNRVSASQSHDNLEASSLEVQKNFPSLTVQEIVNRVRSNPGDPCILETQEPLQDLVRGVLKIFSSKTAPLGAKGWKAFVVYEKSTKSWSWIGPVSSSSSDHDTAEEETSSEAWGIPHKMLVKLVDAFANWLKSGQETLQQIGSLPAPPVMMSPNLDEKERFRDLRAQKSLITISPSSDEVREYFRREEVLRYSVPDRAFSYTAADGKKSTVAPLRRGGGKPTSKARDHFMLKPDRPPHVTILCLVRDAAARLPGSIGTRADVCTLIRDSQYIVEDVSDPQVNQVVSGAMDRLHYEIDPCVQFDGERKIWVYLHRDREEEDFEDDGTSSTKKWKRQRKDATELTDMGLLTDAGYPGIGDQGAGGSSAGYEFNSDPNADSSSIHVGDKSELVYNDMRPNMENIEPFIDSTKNNVHHGHPMGWEVLGVNPLQENRMLCQENSTNEDFDDETFGRERPVGLVSASLL